MNKVNIFRVYLLAVLFLFYGCGGGGSGGGPSTYPLAVEITGAGSSKVSLTIDGVTSAYSVGYEILEKQYTEGSEVEVTLQSTEYGCDCTVSVETITIQDKENVVNVSCNTAEVFNPQLLSVSMVEDHKAIVELEETPSALDGLTFRLYVSKDGKPYELDQEVRKLDDFLLMTEPLVPEVSYEFYVEVSSPSNSLSSNRLSLNIPSEPLVFKDNVQVVTIDELKAQDIEFEGDQLIITLPPEPYVPESLRMQKSLSVTTAFSASSVKDAFVKLSPGDIFTIADKTFVFAGMLADDANKLIVKAKEFSFEDLILRGEVGFSKAFKANVTKTIDIDVGKVTIGEVLDTELTCVARWINGDMESITASMKGELKTVSDITIDVEGGSNNLDDPFEKELPVPRGRSKFCVN